MITIPIAARYCVSVAAHISSIANACSVVVSISSIGRLKVNAKLLPHDNARNRWGGMNICMPQMYASNNSVAKGRVVRHLPVHTRRSGSFQSIASGAGADSAHVNLLWLVGQNQYANEV